MQPVLSGAPWLIAHRSILGINKPYRITLNGRDYVLWQNTQGQISALENVCPHRQAPLSAGWICQERNTITCPFHALEFNAAGHLYQKDTDILSAQPLAHPLDLTIRDDFIWTYGNCSPPNPLPICRTALPKT
ncbi:Rieske 2Fe-2S domain-containing protein [Halomicronema sp. CCY15110]|uniref:Rieske 2Fe-2S domain-containing protein n=1 Tax=Halomicronema sp. CCY15110 TaxID=2767773 RepID=UPI00195178D4|nr:Rieske 2Fe-2S domain-containing protein [Halomicronema sp. CCY15110]